MSDLLNMPHTNDTTFRGDPQDGVHYEPAIGEWCVYIGGYIVKYAGSQAAAMKLYLEELRVRKEHYIRNNANGIPFEGEPGEYTENGSPQDYGLETW